MRNSTRIFALLLICLTAGACVKEKLEVTYSSQESKIDSYIEKNRVSDTDTLRVVRNGGSNRLVLKEGEGQELNSQGSVSFYYAGYIFTGTPSKLFITNHQTTAESAGWSVTDPDYEIFEINMGDTELIDGLRKGLIGVKAGEECEIVFSGKYGFGNKTFGIIPANSALLYKIWVVGVSND